MLRFQTRSLLITLASGCTLFLSACSKPDEAPAPKATGVTKTKDSKPAETHFVPSRLPEAAAIVEADGELDTAVEIERPRPLPPPKLPPPEGATRLDREGESPDGRPPADAWLDAKQGIVIVDGNISLREGVLEMFACLRGTKEHESIVSVNTRAFLIHAALVGLGADPGTPVEFMPMYKPPTGPEIEIFVQWRDEDGNEETVRAQDLVKDYRTGKAMTHPFVFAGSLFWKDPENGRTYYMAEQGDFICVSNFGTAMIDIPVESSQANEERAFLAFTERLPALGTPVRLILKPKLKTDGDKKQDERDEATKTEK